MPDRITLPDFVEAAEGKHPGVEVEYSALTALVRPLFKHRELDEFRHTVMSQSGIAWQHYNAIVLLLSHRFGIQGLLLCRTLFEVVVGTLYLMKNPSLLTDFTDHGKLLFYEQCLAAEVPSHELAKFAKECKAIKERQKGKRRRPWHGSSIEKIAKDVEMGDFYDLLYRYASGATHADATKTLSHGPRGWQQNLESFLSEKEAAIVHYSSFVLTGFLLLQVNQSLKMGNDKEVNALLILMDERAKAVAKPN